MSQKVKSWISNTLKIGLAIGLITHLAKSGKIDLEQLKSLLTGSNIAICLSLMGLSFILSSERWRAILIAQGFQMSFWQAFKLTQVGIFFNFVIPGGVSGDLVKGFYLTRNHPDRKFLAAMTIFLDRVIGLTAMSVMAAISLFYDFDFIWAHNELHVLAIVLIILLLIFCISWGAGFSRKLRQSRLIHFVFLKIPGHHRLFQLWDTILTFKNQRTQFFKSIGYSLLAQIAGITLFIQCGNMLGYHLPIHLYFVVVPIGFMITAIPISPAGVGIGQAAFLFLFNIFQGTENNLGSTTISAFQICSLAWGLLGAVFYILMKDAQRSDIQNPIA